MIRITFGTQTNTATLRFCSFLRKKEKENLSKKPNSLSYESWLHLTYATSPLNSYVSFSGQMWSHEGLQKIHPQNI